MKSAAVNARCRSGVTQTVACLFQFNRQRRSLVALDADEAAKGRACDIAASGMNVILIAVHKRRRFSETLVTGSVRSAIRRSVMERFQSIVLVLERSARIGKPPCGP